VTKRPRIETNEGPPFKNVTITADVMARPDSTYPVVVKPYKLDISQFGEKTRDEMKFTISNVSDSDLTLTLASYPARYATVDLPKSVPAGKSASGTVKLTKKGVEGDFEKSFTIQVSDKANSRFTVPIKRTVKTPGQAASTNANTGGGTMH
jgi:hypothetical protein